MTKNIAPPPQSEAAKTCFQDLPPFKDIVSPSNEKPAGAKAKLALKLEVRPGRHASNLAGAEGSMHAKTSPLTQGVSFKFQPGPRSPQAMMKYFADDTLTKIHHVPKPAPVDTYVHIKLNQPVRVYPPNYIIKAPEREAELTNQKKHLADNNKIREKEILLRKELSDYKKMAEACRREGRSKGEGHAYFCLGVTYDNILDFEKAAVNYGKFATICDKLGDAAGQALAQNCLGISYFRAAERTASKRENYKKSILHHKNHNEIGDLHGKFIAHTNIGIVLQAMGDLTSAIKSHEHALRYAIRISDIQLQSIAVGHLGLSGCAHEDYSTARVCMERYLELVSHLGDIEARESALLHLGYIAKLQGESKAATAFYHQALESAQETNNADNVAIAKVQIGIIRGDMVIKNQMETLASAFAEAYTE
eukprot:CAMPEP_0197518594 /NCGR_PEP_ID=MMETSP1318-20131121/3771_1 /TAXON_ID=552666 /ORGANISM="Partenskyella glossopodia, Strain RCC365" /LENGTH=420 /DNA_ID=CAMNT_0043069063 /DNA_START=64 /DNA_END=1326 /DNA_ORIENTATION=-